MRYAGQVVARLEKLRRAFEERRAGLLAERLTQQLSSLSDPQLQLFSLALRLRDMPPKEAAMVLGQICRGGEKGTPTFQPACLHLLARKRLEEILGEAKLHTLCRELSLLGYGEARRYLSPDPPNLAFERQQEGGRRPSESLGLRISLARRPTPRLMERLIYDPDERVIRTILGNPRLTEAEVLKIASSPRTPPSILSTLAHHHRWVCRYRVKLALVYNPHTPLRVSLGLLPFLLRQDLEEIAHYEPLPAAVRERAQRIVRERKPSTA